MKKYLVFILTLWSSVLLAAQQQDPMDEYVEDLIEEANGDPYLLSMPLLIASQSEDEDNYTVARNQMIPAMKALARDPENNSYAAWLYGRMALGAKYMDDDQFDSAWELKKLLVDEDTEEDLFKSWAYSYAGSLDAHTYRLFKHPMISLADELTLLFQSHRPNKPTASDISWVWAMVMQAAAFNLDSKLYTHAVSNILNTGNYESLTEALSQNVPTSDFILWIHATAYSAATLMDDTENADELESFLVVALEEADPSEADTMLAIVTAQLDP